MVGCLNDIQVVLDDHHCIAPLHQPLEDLDQLVDVGGVEARCRLVQDIDGLACGSLGQLSSQLDPLGLAAGQLGGGLAQLHIAQPHFLQGFQAVIDAGQIFKEGQGLVHRHLQHLVDVLALVAHLQRLPVVPPALAHLAGDIDIGQKVHLDLDEPVAGTGLAPAAPGVEGEASRAIAPAFGVGGGGKQVPDIVEQAGIGGGVGAGRAANGGLVDVDDLVQKLLPLDAVVLPSPGLGPVQISSQLLKQDLVDQGGFARSGYPGNTGKGTQGKLHIHAPQVVLPGPKYLQILPVPSPALGGNGDFFAAGQVVPGDRAWGVHDLLRGAGGHDLAAMNSCAGTHVDDIVRLPHGVLVVLHHQQGVAQIPQLLQGGKQLVVVPLVQTDGGLVQDIQHPHERGTDLGSQPDPLALAAGQGPRLPAEGQVLQAHGA